MTDRPSRRFPALLALALLAMLSSRALAWRARVLDAYQRVPLVKTLSAEDLAGAKPAVTPDKFAIGGKAVRLANDGVTLSFSETLAPGVHGLWLYARVPDSAVMGPWAPLYLEMTVDKPGGERVTSRQRVAYQPMYQCVTRLFFIAREKGSYRVQLKVGGASETALLLDFIEIRNELGRCVRQPLKRARHLVDDAGLARIRAWHREGKNPKPRRSKPKFPRRLPDAAGPPEMAAFLEQVREALPPMNQSNANIRALVELAEAASLDYLRTGNLDRGREAALVLAHLADRYPTLCRRVQDERYIFGRTSYERFGQGNGHAIPPAVLSRVYDRVFDVVRDDAELARVVGSIDPRVKRPLDFRAMLDCNVVQYELALYFRFTRQGMQLSWERGITDVLLVLGPSQVGQQWMDRFLHIQSYADLTGDGAYMDYLVNGINRDAVNYNGGAGYELAVPVNLVLNAVALERFAKLGGQVPPSAYDPKLNHRLPYACKLLLRYRIAGGFMPIGGDYGGANDYRYDVPPLASFGGRQQAYRWGFRHFNDPDLAWMARAYGRPPDADDEEWAAIEKAAADRRNPVLHGGSTTLPGYGYSTIEMGANESERTMKAAAAVRHKTGRGHGHGDMLDLTLYAYNKRVVSDGGRAGWPWMRFSAQHNLVEVDRHSFQATGVNSSYYGYPLLSRQLAGAGFVAGGGWCSSHPQLRDYRRDVAVIDLGAHGEGRLAGRHFYVFDVLRVDGGKVHTYSFHGPQGEIVEQSGGKRQPAPAQGALYGAGNPERGRTTDPFVTTVMGRARKKEQPRAGMRHHLFGLGDTPFYTGLGRNRGYNWDIPFVWIEREAAAPIADAYAAVFEPFLEEANLTQVTPLKVEGGGAGAHAARAVAVTTKWGRQDMVVTNEAGRPVRLGNGLETDAHFAFIARDEQGLISAAMVGGAYLRYAGVELAASRAVYAGSIVSVDPRSLALKTRPRLPAEAAGALVSFGQAPHLVADVVAANGRSLRLSRSHRIFRSPVVRVDAAARAVYPRIALPVTASEPGFYNGAAVANGKGEYYGRIERTEVAEMWMPIFTPITGADLRDADGDGRSTVRLTGFALPQQTRDPVVKYYGPFEKPVRMRQFNREPFAEPVVLEVLRVDPERRRLYFRPPADYDLMWHGWVYDGVIITNEAGDRQWRGNVPARELRLILAGERSLANFGEVIEIYDFGPGDPYRLGTHVGVERVAPGRYRASQNVKATVTLPEGTLDP